MGSSPSTATLLGDEENYLGVAQEQSSRLGTAMALVQVQPPRRTNYPGVTQQQSMWLLTTLALVQVQPPGPRPTVAQQQSKWLLPTRALVQVQLVGLFDLKLSGCSSGGERLLGMQEAAGAIPVFQTSFTATAPRWNAELLTPAAEVRVLSVVRYATAPGMERNASVNGGRFPS